MTHNIIKLLEDLLGTLKKCKNEETDKKTIRLYDMHIDTTDKILSKLKTDGLDNILIDQYFEQETRNYGWSYLPNENGRIAEEAFWNIKKKLS